MGIILDTSLVIASERLQHTAYHFLETVRTWSGDSAIAISAITVLELAHGIARANTESRGQLRQRFLDDLLIALPVHPVSVAIAYRAGQIDGQLRANGITIPTLDLLIGATALDLDSIVATANPRHFELIPNLGLKRF